MQRTEFLVILDQFLPFYPPNNLRNQNFEKLKKTPRDIILQMCTINDGPVIWCMVPEIWSTTDKIFCHFGLFFAFLPLNNPKNQNFVKMEKPPGDIIILHRCDLNENHMMYSFWDTERDRQKFLSFWTSFCTLLLSPLPPSLTTWKTKILKKWKYCLELLSLYTCVP